MTGELVAAAVLVVACALAVWHGRPSAVARRRRRAALRAWERDSGLAALWENLHSVCASAPGLHVAHVSQVYATYRYRGSKAYITWWSTGASQDTWFEGEWPAQGSWVVVSGGTGYGPHNHNPQVFYVGRIHATWDGSTRRRPPARRKPGIAAPQPVGRHRRDDGRPPPVS